MFGKEERAKVSPNIFPPGGSLLGITWGHWQCFVRNGYVLATLKSSIPFTLETTYGITCDTDKLVDGLSATVFLNV